MENELVPTNLGIRVRINHDGTFSIPRSHRVIEAKIDAEYMRATWRPLTWYPKMTNSLNVSVLEGRHSGTECAIVGKGPSLDALTPEQLPTGPILCINEAINKLEGLGVENPLYLVQHDPGLNCRPVRASVLLGFHVRNLYPENHERIMAWVPKELAILTTVSAIRIARIMGCTAFRMIAFDAITSRNCQYAEAVGYKVKKYGHRGPERFLEHGKRIKAELEGEVVTWL